MVRIMERKEKPKRPRCKNCGGPLQKGKKNKKDGSIHFYCPRCRWSNKPREKPKFGPAGRTPSITKV